MLRSLERTSVVLPVMPSQEEPSPALDLAAEDYAAVAEPEVAPQSEEEEELGPPPDFFKAVAAATAAPAPKLGLVQRVVRWFSGLFKKDKK